MSFRAALSREIFMVLSSPTEIENTLHILFQDFKVGIVNTSEAENLAEDDIGNSAHSGECRLSILIVI